MATSAPIFYLQVEFYLNVLLLVAFLVIEIAAFVNCATQRADAFSVVGSLSKVAWLAILGGAVLLTFLCSLSSARLTIFGFIAITASAIYMLDVRPALRDAANGSGSW
jgi:uncharacterized protein DUF2516